MSGKKSENNPELRQADNENLMNLRIINKEKKKFTVKESGKKIISFIFLIDIPLDVLFHRQINMFKAEEVKKFK